MAADGLEGVRLEHVAAGLIERGCALEDGFVRQAHVLRDEFARERLDVLEHLGIEVGELPVPGHDIHAEQIAGADHVLAARPVGRSRALPGVAAVQQQRVAGPRLVPQPADQRPQVGKSADLAIALCRIHEVEVADGVCEAAARIDAGVVQQGLTDEMRRLVQRITDAQVDVGLAEIHRQQLGVTVGEVQQPRLPETRRRIQAGPPAPGRAPGGPGGHPGDRQ